MINQDLQDAIAQGALPEAIALATLWMVIIGSDVDSQPPSVSLENLASTRVTFSMAPLPQPTRKLSCFLKGFLSLLADLRGRYFHSSPPFVFVPYVKL
jgi:hypothetical protein